MKRPVGVEELSNGHQSPTKRWKGEQVNTEINSNPEMRYNHFYASHANPKSYDDEEALPYKREAF